MKKKFHSKREFCSPIKKIKCLIETCIGTSWGWSNRYRCSTESWFRQVPPHESKKRRRRRPKFRYTHKKNLESINNKLKPSAVLGVAQSLKLHLPLVLEFGKENEINCAYTTPRIIHLQVRVNVAWILHKIIAFMTQCWLLTVSVISQHLLHPLVYELRVAFSLYSVYYS